MAVGRPRTIVTGERLGGMNAWQVTTLVLLVVNAVTWFYALGLPLRLLS
jgi:hypothetical protein